MPVEKPKMQPLLQWLLVSKLNVLGMLKAYKERISINGQDPNLIIERIVQILTYNPYRKIAEEALAEAERAVAEAEAFLEVR